MIRTRFAITATLVAALATAKPLPANAASVTWYSPAEPYCARLPKERPLLKAPVRKFRRRGRR